jgi:asparagine synthase (glutamine-hydrolysing)
VAERYGTRHEELRITAPDARELLTTLIRCHDEPFSDAANIPLYLLAKNLDRRIKVVLQGDGGDELFGGYQRYELLSLPHLPWRLASALTHLWPQERRMPYKLARVARMIDALGATGQKRYALLLTVETERQPPSQVLTTDFQRALASFSPFERYREVLTEVDCLDPVKAMLHADLRILLPDTFLEKVDKSTMAHGIEARVPFLDNDLLDYALALPSNYKVKLGQKKRILREALRGLVPDAILDRPKTGFGVPYQSWLRGPLRDYMLSSIRAGRACRDGIIDFDSAFRLSSEHAEHRCDHGFLLWKTLNFSLWYDDYSVSA